MVSAKLITYASTKVMGDGIQERGVHVPLGKHLANLIRSAGDGWEAPLNNPEELDVKVHTDGVFLSGPEVVANSERLNELFTRFPDAIAIEMEGEGKALNISRRGSSQPRTESRASGETGERLSLLG